MSDLEGRIFATLLFIGLAFMAGSYMGQQKRGAKNDSMGKTFLEEAYTMLFYNRLTVLGSSLVLAAIAVLILSII